MIKNFSFRNDAIDNWIFVTGVPRSGTTFVGEVLSSNLRTDYLHEPFLSGKNLPIEERHVYVSIDNKKEIDKYSNSVDKIMKYKLRLDSGINPDDSWYVNFAKSVVGGRGPINLLLAKFNFFHKNSIVKDPTAGLMTEFLYSEFDFKPVIVVRHPVSLVSSLKRMGWHPTLEYFRDQRDLINDYFEDEKQFLRKEWGEIELDGAAHWRAINKVLLEQYKRNKEDWILVKHEEVSKYPIVEFKRIYSQLGLPWSRWVARRVRKLTEGRSADASNSRAQDLRRNSANIFEKRREEIPAETRRDIFEITSDVALQLYDRESFAID